DLHHIDPLEINHLARKVLYRGLPFLEDKAQDIIKACLETLPEVLGFGGGLGLRIFLGYDFPTLFTSIDGDRPSAQRAELGTFHGWKLDVVGKDIGTGQFAESEPEESAG